MNRNFLVNFNLPFRIALEDSNIALRNSNVTINILWFRRNGVISRHRNVLFSKKDSHWVKDDISHGIVLESSTQQKFWIGEQKSADSSVVGYVEDGIYGESAFHYFYTEVFIYLQYARVNQSGNTAVKDAIEALNYFVKVYRDVTSDTNVSTVSADDIERIRLFEIMNEGFDIYNQKKSGEKVNLQPLGDALNLGTLKALKPFSTNFDESMLSGIQDRIRRGYQSPLWFEVLLDAKEQCFKHKNYDLAVVLLETSFEVFLDFSLKNKMFAANVSDEEIANKLQCPFLSKLTQQLPKYLKKAINENISEYTDWFNHLYSLRIKIVHQGFKGCMEQDVTKAYNALMKLIVYIDNYETIRGFF